MPHCYSNLKKNFVLNLNKRVFDILYEKQNFLSSSGFKPGPFKMYVTCKLYTVIVSSQSYYFTAVHVWKLRVVNRSAVIAQDIAAAAE